jgi:putative cell wall-binding protein
VVRRARSALALAGGATALVSAVALAAPAQAFDVDRLSGTDRFGTAAAISGAGFPDPVDTVYVVNGLGFADALAAAPAAALAGVPVLLVKPDAIPDITRAELARLQPSEIVVVGGTGAVSSGVQEQLGAYAAQVTRLQGTNRYGTAKAVALDAEQRQGTDAQAPDVVVASGESYADALSGGDAAAMSGGVLLLTAGATLPAETRAALEALHPASITIVGGPGVVSTEVEAALRTTTSGPTERVYGDDRFATAARVQSLYTGDDASFVLLANGLDFPDALAGAALGVPLLLSRPACLPAATAAAYQQLGTTYVEGLGGTAALSDPALSGTPCTAAASGPPASPAPSATASPTASANPPANPGDSKNCTDFTTWRQAQDWYDAYAPTYGDVAGLDADHDGVACETLPGAPA